MTAPLPGTKLITPSGRPASLNTLKIIQLESNEVDAGFHNTTFPKRLDEPLKNILPIRAGDEGKFAPIAVKLKGEIATTYPSYSRLKRIGKIIPKVYIHFYSILHVNSLVVA